MRANPKIMNFVKNTFLSALALFLAGCGASAPVTPVQIPSAIEFAGGDVTGDIVVQMGKDLGFIVKDADGEQITTLPDGITAKLYDATTAEEVTDSSCGNVEIATDELVYTAPANWKGILSRCEIRGFYDGDQLATPYTMKITLSPAVADGDTLAFSTLPALSDGSYPNLAIDEAGTLYVCYSSASSTVKLIKSSDLGATWSTPVTIDFNQFYDYTYVCSIDINSDASLVAVSARYSEPNEGNMLYGESVAFSTDGGASFATPISIYNLETYSEVWIARAPVASFDSNNVLHILAYLDFIGDAYISHCSPSECADPFASSDISGNLVGSANLYIGSDDNMLAVWNYVEPSTGGINTISYAGSAYTVGTPQQFSSETTYWPIITSDVNGLPIVSWGDTTHSYFGTWDSAVGELTGQTTVATLSTPYNMLRNRLFITPDNYKRIMYTSYDTLGESFTPITSYVMQNDDGGFTTPKNITIENFSPSDGGWNLVTDTVGRPYVIWNTLVTSDTTVYLAIGSITE